MKISAPRLLAGLVILLAGSAFVITGIAVGEGIGDMPIMLTTGSWFVIGALIVVLRPENAIGWVFAAIGLTWASGVALSGYAEEAAPGALLTFASWYGEWFWLAGLFLIVATLYVFPTGHVPSRTWRPVLGVVVVGGTAAVVYAALEPEVQASDSTPVVHNPIGVTGLTDIEATPVLNLVLFFLLVFGALAGASSLIVRYRRSRGVEREQLKWMALAGPVAVVGYLAAGMLDSLGFKHDIFWVLPFLAIPVGVGIAILRHQLFDVDRLISRTLVYGSLTVVLGASYVGFVLLGQALFSSFAGGSNLAIAASTLVVAALFLPVRSRVQRFVDRRFYRRRYDAQRTLEAFGTRLREQVELDAFSVDLLAAVGETMQPAFASLWLNDSQATRNPVTIP